MKFEMPKIEVLMFNVTDVLTASSSSDEGDDSNAYNGAHALNGTCIGTMQDYGENNCPAY